MAEPLVEMTYLDAGIEDARQRAKQGRVARKQFKDEHPTAYQHIGDVAKNVRQVLVDKITGSDALFKEASGEHVGAMRAELAGPNPTRTEQLLADHAALCWLHLHWLELRLLMLDGAALDQAESLETRISQAQRRFLAALTTLERVRALMRPAINVQRLAIIGRQQIVQVEREQHAAMTAGSSTR